MDFNWIKKEWALLTALEVGDPKYGEVYKKIGWGKPYHEFVADIHEAELVYGLTEFELSAHKTEYPSLSEYYYSSSPVKSIHDTYRKLNTSLPFLLIGSLLFSPTVILFFVLFGIWIYLRHLQFDSKKAISEVIEKRWLEIEKLVAEKGIP